MLSDTENNRTLENQKAVELLQNNWNIAPATIAPIPLGNALCWRITPTTGDDLFFKQMRDEVVGSEERVREILEVQNYFASKGLPVVKSVQTVDGKFYVHNQGALFILYPFVQSIQKTHRSELNQQNLDSMADTLAKMHLAGAASEAPQISKIFIGWKTPEKFNARVRELRSHLAQKAQASSLDELDQLVLKALDVKERIINGNNVRYEDLGLQSDHLTHGDYREQNVFFDKNGNVEWIIDFDACEMAPRGRELARAIDLLCIDRKDLSAEGLVKAKRFFQRYNAIYPITQDELYKGWFTNLMKTAMSLFAYTEYYFNKDQRPIRFIQEEDAEELEKYFDRLREIIEVLF